MEKHAGGRPVLYETAEEMQGVIDNYFNTDAWIDSGETKMFAPTMSGLAYALGMSRQSLINYGNKDEFFDTVKRARDRVAIALEQRLYGNNVTGIIFNLKNNFGWVDRVESTNTNVEVSHEEWLNSLK